MGIQMPSTNKPSAVYQDALSLVHNLPPSDALRLAVSILTRLQAETPTSATTHSLLELRGLGKELWQTVDTDTYIEQERQAWDG